MMVASELLCWFNGQSFAKMIERADDLDDLVDRALVRIVSDRDAVIGVAATSSTPTLPATAAGLA
jgi:hypothetical protein